MLFYFSLCLLTVIVASFFARNWDVISLILGGIIVVLLKVLLILLPAIAVFSLLIFAPKAFFAIVFYVAPPVFAFALLKEAKNKFFKGSSR